MWKGSSSLLSGQSSLRGQPVRKYMTANSLRFDTPQCRNARIVGAPLFPPKVFFLIQASHGCRLRKGKNFNWVHAVPVFTLVELSIRESRGAKDPSSRWGYTANPWLASAFQVEANERSKATTDRKQKQPGPEGQHTAPNGELRQTNGSINFRSCCRVSSYGVWTNGV